MANWSEEDREEEGRKRLTGVRREEGERKEVREEGRRGKMEKGGKIGKREEKQEQEKKEKEKREGERMYIRSQVPARDSAYPPKQTQSVIEPVTKFANDLHVHLLRPGPR
jgi:hypothetical protein